MRWRLCPALQIVMPTVKNRHGKHLNPRRKITATQETFEQWDKFAAADPWHGNWAAFVRSCIEEHIERATEQMSGKRKR